MHRVFAVLLPGTSIEPESLEVFLKQYVWVDFRSGLENYDTFGSLLRGIRGEQPDLSLLSTEETFSSMAAEPPYRGFEVFRTRDADLFFGRKALTDYLIERLREDRFLVLVGPSGSGKSSLVYAGLLPALKKGALPGSASWRTVPVRPGSEPLMDLAGRISEFFVSPQQSFGDWQKALATAMCEDNKALGDKFQKLAPEHFLVIVDQCEAIVNLGSSDPERRAFFANLINASSLSASNVTVVLVLRADFYSHLDTFPELAFRVGAHQVYVTSLQEDDLRQAINRPAEQAGLRFQEGLVERILAEMRGYREAMPLLQEALRELWNRREGSTLTFAAYYSIGEVKGAIASSAEAVFAKLSPPQQETARRILVELVQQGEDTPDTRRRMLRSEFLTHPNSAEETDLVIELLIQHRLLTGDVDSSTRERTVELAHDALFKEWPKLRDWLEQYRSPRLARKNLQDRVIVWERHHRNKGSLVEGSELEEYEMLRRDHPDWLSIAQREYLEACTRNQRRDSQGPDLIYFNGLNPLGKYLTQPIPLRQVVKRLLAEGWQAPPDWILR